MTSVSASFTQQQCAVLLAHAFLGTFPERDSMNEKFNTFSMHRYVVVVVVVVVAAVVVVVDS